MRKFLSAVGAGSALVAAVTLVGAGAAFAETVKVGVVSALSGPGSAWGLGIDGGVRVAVKELNEKGGLEVGGKTYTFEVISYDDKFKTADTVTAVTRLVEQDRVKFIFGPLGSASVLAAKPIFEQDNLLAFVNSYSDKVLDKATKNTFRVLPTTSEIIEPMVKWLKQNKPDLKTVAIISPNDDSGWATQKIQKESYAKGGYNVVSAEFFERSVKDFQPLLTKMLASKPDIIELDTTPPPTAGVIIRQARELGYKGQFVKIGGPGVPEMVGAAGAAFANGTIVYVAAEASQARYKWLEQQYATIHPPPMNAFAVFFYDSTRILFAAMKKAGTVSDVAKIRAALVQVMPFEGMQGQLTWTGMDTYGIDHQILAPVFVGVIENGAEKVLSSMSR